MKGTETSLGPFTRGMNNVSSETELPEGALRDALNVDITRHGQIRMRGGYTKLRSLVNGHSMYSNGVKTLLVNNGFLCVLLDDNDTLVPVAPIAGDSVSYATINGIIYWTDGVNAGAVAQDNTNMDAWVPAPSGQPTLAAATGAFQPGTYQVAVTFVDAAGMESGADQAAVIELLDVGGIHLTDIPQSGDAAYVHVYVTAPNGTEPRNHANISMGTTEYTLTAPRMGRALETQFADKMPPGDILCHHYGRLYVASGNTMVYSEALRPGLTRIMDNYMVFPADITIVLSHLSGLYVVADQAYFLPGGDPAKMGRVVAYPFSGVKGTGQIVSASMFGVEAEGGVPYWFSDNGPVLGLTGGVVLPLTEDAVGVPAYASGATMFREIDGIRSMLTSLRGPGHSSKYEASASASFEVRRNGIIVPE